MRRARVPVVAVSLLLAATACAAPAARDAGPRSAPSQAQVPAPATPAEPEPSALATRQLSNGAHFGLSSSVLGERREVLVYTPPSYADSADRYPVLYLLDGEAHFQHVAGIVGFLVEAGRIPPMIVVGVVNTVRNRDLTPTREAGISDSGGAGNFARFLADELVPAIDERYRTQPYRLLAGHSYGGLFAVYALVEHPTLFHGLLAASPSLQWGDGALVRAAQERWRGSSKLDGFFYFTLGSEPRDITRANRAFESLLAASAPTGLAWSFELLADEDHSSTPHRTVYDGLVAAFAPLRLPDDVRSAAAVREYYRGLSGRYRFAVEPSERQLTNLGYELLGADRNRDAIGVFRLLVESYPEGPNSHDCLGEALEKIGELDEALASYERAVAKAAAMNHQLLEIFTRNRDRVRDKLGAR